MRKVRQRRKKMRKAGATCPRCNSHDIRFMGRSPFNHDHRPVFGCGSCDMEWRAGTEGKPYSDFVNVKEWFHKEALKELTPQHRQSLRAQVVQSNKEVSV